MNKQKNARAQTTTKKVFQAKVTGCLYMYLYICLSVCLHVYMFLHDKEAGCLHVYLQVSISIYLCESNNYRVSKKKWMYVCLYFCLFKCLSDYMDKQKNAKKSMVRPCYNEYQVAPQGQITASMGLAGLGVLIELPSRFSA